MKLIRAKFGLEGIGFVIELWAMIYREGYYLIWDDETQLLFFNEVHISPEKGIGIITFGIEKGLFRIFKIRNQHILTSSGVQKRYIEASLKRKELHFCPEIMLVHPTIPSWSQTQLIQDSVDDILDSESAHSESESAQKDSETPLSEPKGSKGSKGSKGKEVKEPENQGAPPSDSPTARPAEVLSRLSNPNGTALEQQRAMADRLRVEDPDAYRQLVKKHPELAQIGPQSDPEKDRWDVPGEGEP
jgi:hypothetical protein